MTNHIMQIPDSPKALFVFMHGAGADINSSFMTDVSDRLVKQNIGVLRFNFPYMDKRADDGKRRPPDRMPVLVESLSEQLQAINSELPLFIGGKSMGSRVAATWLSEVTPLLAERVNGFIAIGYPFHPIGKPDKLRLTPLIESGVTGLILQGERDKLGSKDEISTYNLPERYQVELFADGDHDLKPRVKSGYTHQQHIIKACHLIKEFINARI